MTNTELIQYLHDYGIGSGLLLILFVALMYGAVSAPKWNWKDNMVYWMVISCVAGMVLTIAGLVVTCSPEKSVQVVPEQQEKP